MADALNTSALADADADIKAYYPYDNPDGIVPEAKQVVTIDNGGFHADCIIMDATDAPYTPADATQWINDNKTQWPTVYCNLSSVEDLLSETKDVTRDWWLWVADWDNTENMPPVPALPGNVWLMGWQYASGQWDSSIVASANWVPLEVNVNVQMQNGWKWCEKCSALWYPSGGQACAAGGTHDAGPSDAYAVAYTTE